MISYIYYIFQFFMRRYTVLPSRYSSTFEVKLDEL